MPERPPPPQGLERPILLGFGVAIALLAAAAVGAQWSGLELERDQAMVAGAWRTLEHVHRLEAQATEVDRRLDGYIITRDPASRDRLQQRLAAMTPTEEALVADAEPALGTALRADLRAFREQLEGQLADVAAGRGELVVEGVRAGAGERTMDAVLADLHAIEGRERQGLAAGEAEALAIGARTRWLIGGGDALAAVLVGTAVLTTQRSVARRRAIEAEREGLIIDCAECAARVRRDEMGC